MISLNAVYPIGLAVWPIPGMGGSVAETFRFALEDDSGDVLLESGDYILLEIA